MILLRTSLALLLLAAASSAWKTYNGYRLLETSPLTKEQGRVLVDAGAQWDFWMAPRQGASASILVSPEEFAAVEKTLADLGVQFKVTIDDLERAMLYAQGPSTLQRPSGRSISFTRYNNLTEIHAYLDELAREYPQLVTVHSAGRSTEGRDLKYVKISDGSGGSSARAVFIDATIHAREWIAPPVALYTIYQLVENYNANKKLLEGVEYYILPVINPDGYEYTFTNERLWRKTRSVTGDPSCPGVDANRNFDNHWMEIGASASKCSATYAGPKAASEPETQALEALLTKLAPQIDLYLTLHSYGQYLLLPFGYSTQPTADFEELLSLANTAAKAVEAVRGTKYTVGNSAAVLYATSGSSQDWAKGGAGIKYSYTIELPGGGIYGFNPPASSIQPVVTETFEAVRVFGEFVRDLSLRKRQDKPYVSL